MMAHQQHPCVLCGATCEVEDGEYDSRLPDRHEHVDHPPPPTAAWLAILTVNALLVRLSGLTVSLEG
jgi:hypothetical protein